MFGNFVKDPLWNDAWQRLKRNPLAMIGLCYLIFIGLLCLFTPWVAPYAYDSRTLRWVPVHPHGSTGWAPITLVVICSPE